MRRIDWEMILWSVVWGVFIVLLVVKPIGGWHGF